MQNLDLDTIYLANLKKNRPRMNMTNKKCVHPLCITEPIYNHPMAKSGLYCGIHKLDGMIDVKNAKCTNELCKKRANYNYPGFSKGLFCAKHQKEGMTNVVYKLCPYKCGRIPQFNFPGERKGLYCSVHKEPEMVNVKKRTLQDYMYNMEVNLIKKRCLDPLIKKYEDTIENNNINSSGEGNQNDSGEGNENDSGEDLNNKSMFEIIAENSNLEELDILMMNSEKINKYQHLFKYAKNEKIIKILISKLIKKIKEEE
jgi:hypothetical protein